MSIAEFINHLKSSKKDDLKSLYKKPVPENRLHTPITQVFHKGVYQQADILYLPDDKGYKYLLVIVDLYDGSMDCEPLKDILSKNNDVLQGFKKIYNRKYLQIPLILTLDQGNEFKQFKVVEYLKSLGIQLKYALSGRSRQLANVERMNQKIGTILHKRMANQELITHQTNRDWVSDIPDLVKYLNNHKKKPLKQEISPDPIADDYSGNLLKIGQKVRILLDKPKDIIHGTRLYGKFRSSDPRWTNEIYKITEVLLKPGFPPMYLTDKDDMVARTKNQFQIITGREKEANSKFIRGTPEYYRVSKILDKRVVNRKTEYLCKWYGFPENQASWISAKELDRTKDLKEMKRKFNEEND